MKLGRTILAVAGAAALLSVLVGAATAARLSTSNQQLRATFARLDFTGGFGTIECSLTMEGSFHERSVAKTAGSLTGLITSATIGLCARGSGTVLSETLPWHVQYDGFSGTLPNISAIRARIIGMAMQIREPTFGVTCLSRSTAAQPALITFNREASGVLTSATAGGRITTSCGGEGQFAGTSTTLTVMNSGSRITVSLI